MGSLCAKNAIEKFSRLGTFKRWRPMQVQEGENGGRRIHISNLAVFSYNTLNIVENFDSKLLFKSFLFIPDVEGL